MKMLQLAVPTLLVMLMSIAIAEACSCGRYSPIPTEESFSYSNVIGIFKLLRRERIVTDAERKYSREMVVFSVEKVYKGGIRVGEERIFEENDCSLKFKGYTPGTEFLFYLGPFFKFSEKYWSVSFCTSSGLVADSAADLRYLDNLDKFRGKTRIYGELLQIFFGALEGEKPAIPLANWPVFITANGKTIELKTDENGLYEIYGLEPGRYSINTRQIKGFKERRAKEIDHLPPELQGDIVEIGPNRHAVENIFLSIDTSVSGRVVDATGRSLEGVQVELIPSRGPARKDFSRKTETRVGGAFEINGIPKGAYLVRISEKGEATGRVPANGSFFHPATTDRAKAGEISIEPGTHLRDMIIKSPQADASIRLSGRVVDAFGKPVSYMEVGFFEGDLAAVNHGPTLVKKPRYGARTDSEGRFSFAVPAVQGWVYALSDWFTAPNTKCPRRESSGPMARHLYVTNKLKVDGDRDISGIELKFPPETCEQ